MPATKQTLPPPPIMHDWLAESCTGPGQIAETFRKIELGSFNVKHVLAVGRDVVTIVANRLKTKAAPAPEQTSEWQAAIATGTENQTKTFALLENEGFAVLHVLPSARDTIIIVANRPASTIGVTRGK